MVKYYACRIGEFTKNSHFHKTFHTPIVKKEYQNIRWAINEGSISKKIVASINRDIKNGIKIYVVLFPNKPNNYPYAICELNLIKERILGPLIAIDETNSERGWINGTSSGNDDFKYDFKFSKIYLLNKKSFNKIKLKGQKTFFQLRNGIKNEDLFKQIEIEMKFIKIYIQPIICSF
tara:strand:- start:767 stop:1297 length:531 start_codon:yes stop_codon:yes gene_type:complete